MSLFSKMRLDKAVNNCRSLLERVAQELRPAQDPEHTAKAEQFMAAVDRYDNAAVNDLIEEALQRYCHCSNSLEGLERYCKKFGIDEDLLSMSEVNRILFIAGHKSQISERLEHEKL